MTKPGSKTPDAGCAVVAWQDKEHRIYTLLPRIIIESGNYEPLIRQSDHLAKVAELEAVIAAKTAEVERLQEHVALIVQDGLAIRLTYRDGATVLNTQRMFSLHELSRMRMARKNVEKSSGACFAAIDAALNERNKS